MGQFLCRKIVKYTIKKRKNFKKIHPFWWIFFVKNHTGQKSVQERNSIIKGIRKEQMIQIWYSLKLYIDYNFK